MPKFFDNGRSRQEAGYAFNTFKRYALKLGCYAVNPSGKGVSKPRAPSISTDDILAGKYQDYETYKLKKRLNNVLENYRIFPNTQSAIIKEKAWKRT